MLIHGVQVHPVTRRPLHVDLFLVRMTEELTVDVPLISTGTSVAGDRRGRHAAPRRRSGSGRCPTTCRSRSSTRSRASSTSTPRSPSAISRSRRTRRCSPIPTRSSPRSRRRASRSRRSPSSPRARRPRAPRARRPKASRPRATPATPAAKADLRRRPGDHTARQGAIESLRDTVAPFLRFFEGPVWARRDEPEVSNFAVGNPQEMPLPAYVDALARALPPQDKDWFAYKLSEAARQASGGRHAHPADRPRLGPRRRVHDQRRVRGDRRVVAGDPGAGRRGDLPVATLVLLRDPHPRCGRRARPGHPVATELRPRRRRGRGGHHPADSRGLRQHPAQPHGPDLPPRPRWNDWARCSPRRPSGPAGPSTSSRTSRTTGSCSMGASSTARPSATPTP